ncbi:hypothetical protein RCS94_01965 [Orbaceae bacterium ac157xtp]
MKKIIFNVLGLISFSAIGFVVYLALVINDTDVFYYKSARFCSDIIKPIMKSPTSYKYQSLGVLYKTEAQDVLFKQIKDKNYLKESFDEGQLNLISYSTVVTYSSKNSHGVELDDLASCDFIAISDLNKSLPFSTELITINLDGKQYKEDNSPFYLNIKLKTSSLDKIGIMDKFNYFIERNKYNAHWFN